MTPDESAPDTLDGLIAEYLRLVDAGAAPRPEAFADAHPGHAAGLRSYFRDQARFAPDFDPEKTGPAADDASAGPGDVVRYFGDYELVAELARGGMGVVYKARQVSLNRPVALKMILAGRLASPADVQRFRTEAEAAAQLDHPHILPVYEVGTHEGQHYFTMKLVTGGSLAGRLAEYRADPRRAAALVATVARAVAFAHRHGILHRDLKPSNILLDDGGAVFVADFGLAKRVEGGAGLTQSGAVVGTPSYMAPEQARAEKAITTAVDVFALGAILYELLTGRPPFRAPTVLDTLLQVIECAPPAPRSLNPAADRDLATIAMKCLNPDPDRRYDSAGALADDLDRWARGEPIRARPVGPAERLVKWVRRHRTAAALAATAATLVLVLAVGGPLVAWLRREADDLARREADAKARTVVAQAETAAEQIAAAQRQAEASLRRAQAVRTSGEGRPADAVDAVRVAARQREAMLDAVSRLGDGRVAAAERVEAFWTEFAPRLREEALVWASQSFVQPTATRRLPAPAAPPPPERLPGGGRAKAMEDRHGEAACEGYDVSPDATKVARVVRAAGPAREAVVQVFDLTGAAPQEFLYGAGELLAAAVAFTAADRLLVAVATNTGGPGRRRERLDIITQPLSQPEPAARVTVDLPTPPPISQLPRPDVASLGFSADRQRVLYLRTRRDQFLLSFTGPYQARAFAVADGKVLFDGSYTSEVPIDWTPDGTRVVLVPAPGRSLPTGPRPEPQLVIRGTGPNDQTALKVPDLNTAVERLSFSSDGRRLFTAGNQGPVLVEEGRAELTALDVRRGSGFLHTPSGQPMRLPPLGAFSPDGTLLAVLTHESFALIHLPDGRVAAEVPHAPADDRSLISGEQPVQWQPQLIRFLDERRVATVITERHRFRPSGDERAQVWEFSLARSEPQAPFRLWQTPFDAVRALPGDRRAVYTYRGGLGVADFARTQSRSTQDKGGQPKVETVATGRWSASSSPGPDWSTPELVRDPAPLTRPARPVSPVGVPDFTAGGRRFLESWSEGRPYPRPGVVAFDPASGQVVQRFDNAEEFARSDDGRFIALLSRPRFDEAVAAKPGMDVIDLTGEKPPVHLADEALAGCYRFWFSPDGRCLVGHGTNTVVITRLDDGQTFPPIRGEDDYMTGPTFDPTGERMAILGRPNQQGGGQPPDALVVSLKTGQIESRTATATGRNFNSAVTFAFSPDGRVLAVVNSQNRGLQSPADTVQLWAVGEPQFRRLGGDGAPGSLWSVRAAFNADGRRLVVVGSTNHNDVAHSRVLEIWDIVENKRLARTTYDGRSIGDVRLLPGGQSLVANVRHDGNPQPSAPVEERCEIWDLADGTVRKRYPGWKWCAQSPDGSRLLLADLRTYRLLTADSLDEVALPSRVLGRLGDNVPFTQSDDLAYSPGAPFSPDGRYLKLADGLWDVAAGKLLPLPPAQWPAFTPDVRGLLGRDPATGVHSLYETATGRKLCDFDLRGPTRHPEAGQPKSAALRFSPDGKHLAVVVANQIRLFDAATGRPTAVLPSAGHAGAVTAVAVNADGRWVATSGDDGTVRLWDAETGRPAGLIDGFPTAVTHLAWATGDRLLVGDAGATLEGWDVTPSEGDRPFAAARRWRTEAPPGRTPLAVEPDGRRFARGGADGTLRIGDPADGSVSAPLTASAAVTALAFVPAGQGFVAATADTRLGTWDQALAPHGAAVAGEVRAVAVAPDGALVVTAGAELRLWATEGLRPLMTLRRPTKPLRDVALSADGRWLYTAGEDGSVEVIDLAAVRNSLARFDLGW